MTSKEQPQPPNPFGLTEHEELWDQISDERLRALIEDPATTIHKLGIDANNYGEFVFVTLSREAAGQRQLLTFWGMGYHEGRERWITNHWNWYRANLFPDTLRQQMSLEEAQEMLEQRREEISPYLSEDTQTSRGRLFELLADLTDEDGAYTELEDLGEAANWLLSIDPNDLSDDLPTTKRMFGDDGGEVNC